MRSILVFSVFLAACGGSIEAGAPEPPSPGGAVERPEVQPPATVRTCGEAHKIVEVPEGARALTTSDFRLAWLEDRALVMLEGSEKRTIADDVATVAGSKTMFAFTFADGGVGTYRSSTSLHPTLRAERVLPSFEDLAFVSTDGVLRRAAPDGEPREIAHAVSPVFAVEGDSTWYLAEGALHRDGAVVAEAAEAPELATATEMFAAGDRAFVGFGDHVSVVSGGAITQVWQDPYVDFVADEREVIVAKEHALERMSGSNTQEISLGSCTVRELTMNGQIVYALVEGESGSMIVGVAR
jgi:hypothetical protein